MIGILAHECRVVAMSIIKDLTVANLKLSCVALNPGNQCKRMYGVCVCARALASSPGPLRGEEKGPGSVNDRLSACINYRHPRLRQILREITDPFTVLEQKLALSL